MKQGWEVKKLGDAMHIARGGSPRPIKKYITDDPNGINWIKIGDASDSSKYIYKTKEKINKDGLHKTRFVEEGDFLLSNSMSFGRPYIMKTTGCIHDGWLVLKENNTTMLDKDFLYHLLCSPYIFEQFDRLAAGSTVRNLNIALVSSVEIPIPPLDEQKRIVAKLDECFEAIDKARANVEKNLNNAKGLFLSRKNDLFKKLEEDLSKVPLPSVCDEIFAGGDAPKDNYSKEKTETFNIPIIANAVKYNGLYGYTNKVRVSKPSVTIAARGSGTGHTEIRYEPFFPIVRLIVIIPNVEKVKLEFLKYSIQNFDIMRSGSAIPQLTVPMIKDYSLSLPSISDQNQIVSQLDELKSQTQSLESNYQQELDALDELKKTILQKAFNGEL